MAGFLFEPDIEEFNIDDDRRQQRRRRRRRVFRQRINLEWPLDGQFRYVYLPIMCQ